MGWRCVLIVGVNKMFNQSSKLKLGWKTEHLANNCCNKYKTRWDINMSKYKICHGLPLLLFFFFLSWRTTFWDFHLCHLQKCCWRIAELQRFVLVNQLRIMDATWMLQGHFTQLQTILIKETWKTSITWVLFCWTWFNLIFLEGNWMWCLQDGLTGFNVSCWF